MMWEVLLDIVLLLGGALLLGGLASRFGQSPLVGYLLAGMLLGGPGAANVIQFEHDVEAVSELGVSLLLFSLGLEFSWDRLQALGFRLLLGGVAQVVVTAVVGAWVGTLFGLGIREAVAVGAMVCLSSTACVLRVLSDKSEMDSVHGRNSLVILLVQDIAVVPLGILMVLLAGAGSASATVLVIGRTFLLAGLLVAGLYFVLNVVAVRALGALTLERNRELTVLLAAVTGLGSAWAAHQAGLSPAMGAFAAGLFLGGSHFATQIRADIASLRVVLLTLFFGAAGMVANPLWMLAHWWLVLGVTALMLVVKLLVMWGVFRALGQSHGQALSAGLCLGQIGEFAFVLGSTARAVGVLSDEVFLLIVSSAIVTLLFTPYLVSRAPAIGLWVDERLPTRARRPRDSSAAHRLDSVIIGFGPAGECVAHALEGRPHEVLVLDLNAQALRRAAEYGIPAQVGDATQDEVLEHAGIRTAKTIVITLPSPSAALTVLRRVRYLAPEARTIVRTRYHRHRPSFVDAGAHVVIDDEFQAGEKLAQCVLVELDEKDHRPPRDPERKEAPG